MALKLAPRARAFKNYSDARFDRLAGISNGHLCNTNPNKFLIKSY
ncbi:MAG: hypothetical protein Q8Q40_07690 [Methylococcaceae bacterium]|nr:hypothetical protein [Methylococcaceae bacterium]MDP3903844.1 hypothetical protein [Methylococcaceae bacterium]